MEKTMEMNAADQAAKNGREEATDEQNEQGDENGERQINHFVIQVHTVPRVNIFYFKERRSISF